MNTQSDIRSEIPNMWLSQDFSNTNDEVTIDNNQLQLKKIYQKINSTI